MKILIVPDSFKDALSAREVAEHIETGIRLADPKITCIKIPIADGGEGTVDAILDAVGGKRIMMKALDPLGREIESFFGITADGRTAVIEMAAASGLERLSQVERNPMVTSSYGTGQLISAALDERVEKIILGLGGSATNDAGAGMAEALGYDFFDDKGNRVHPCGQNLSLIREIKTGNARNELKSVSILLACDVSNPMIGTSGASYIYGPQKGATPEMAKRLDSNLGQFGRLLEKISGTEIVNVPGTGAAGGLAAVLLAFTHAEIRSGFRVISDLADLESRMQDSDLIITGEGKLDDQSLSGKVPYAVLQAARKFDKPVIVIAGNIPDSIFKTGNLGFTSVFSILNQPCSLEEAVRKTSQLIQSTSFNIMRLIGSGRT